MPVAIIRAGPTGVMLRSSSRGAACRCGSSTDRRRRRVKRAAIGIHARTLELFHQLGIVDEFLARGHQVTGVEFHTSTRRPVVARFDRIDSPYPFLLTMSQEVTQANLDRRLDELGVRVERGVSVLDFMQDPDGVELRISTEPGGGERTVRADWSVGCDGAHSLVRRRLGVSFDGEDYAQDSLMAEVRAESPLRRDHFDVFAHTAAPLPMFPLPENRWRIFVPEVPRPSSTGRAAAADDGRDRTPSGGAGACRSAADRPHPVGHLPRIPTPCSCDARRPGVRGRRRGPHPQPGRRAGDEHRPPGRRQPRLEARARRLRPGAIRAARHLPGRARADRRRRARLHPRDRAHLAQRSPRRRWLRDRLLPLAAAIPAAERYYTTRLAQLSHSYRGGPLARPQRLARLDRVRAGDRMPDVLEHLRLPDTPC